MAEIRKANLKVFRFDPEVDKETRFDRYQVDARKGMTVLEALFDVLENQDGSLAFRYACRGAVCGSCAMHINGLYRLACQTQISELGSSEIVVQPLGHLPIIKDLVVDMTSFFEKYEQVMPYLMNSAPAPERERLQTIKDRSKIDEQLDCILCACCHASCTMTLTDEKYLGPAILLKVDRFASDSRDEARPMRLKAVDSEHGVWRCHTIFNCAEACPKQINPTHAIARLKRGAIVRKLLHPFRPWPQQVQSAQCGESSDQRNVKDDNE